MIKRGMKKKSQVSIFVIFAIVLIITGVISYYFYNKYDANNYPSIDKSQVDLVHGFVIDCLSEVYKQSLDDIGKRGGYIREPLSEYLDTGFQTIPFYYLGGMRYIPDEELLSEELSYGASLRMNKCFLQINDYWLDYIFEFKDHNISFLDNEVIFISDIKLTLIQGEKRGIINFKDYPIIIDSRLKGMNSLASYIAYSNDINQGGICISCILEISKDKNFNVEIENDLGNVLLVNIVDNKSEDNPRLYRFLMTDLTENAFPKVNLSLINPYNNSKNVNIVAPKS
jgi:hypothetical protein